MTTTEIENRLAALEQEVAQLRSERNGATDTRPWWVKIAGRFANDPDFAEAMRLGRKTNTRLGGPVKKRTAGTRRRRRK